MKEFLADLGRRLAYKTSGFKSLFTIAVLASLWLHDFSDNNADVLMFLVGTVLTAKVAQYVTDAVKDIKKGK